MPGYDPRCASCDDRHRRTRALHRREIAGRLDETFRIVADNPWPHRIAALGLLLIAVGVLRAERTDPDPEEARE